MKQKNFQKAHKDGGAVNRRTNVSSLTLQTAINKIPAGNPLFFHAVPVRFFRRLNFAFLRNSASGIQVGLEP